MFFMGLFLIVCQTIGRAQAETQALTDYFQAMPSEFSNKQLRALADNPAKHIPVAYYATLQMFNSTKFAAPIGKIETKKTIILLYAEIDPVRTDGSEAMVAVHAVTLDGKSNRFLEGSTIRYVAMSGDDAVHHESNMKFSNNQLVVNSEESNIHSGVSTKKETTIYEAGKKHLEFVATK